MVMNSGWRFLMGCMVLLLTSPLLIAQDTVLEKSLDKNAFTMDVAVNIVGVEAAAKELSSAMKEVAGAINQALKSDKLSAAERQELLQVLGSFKGIKEKFSLSLENARDPIKNIVADTSSQLSHSVQGLNQSIVEPLAFKFQLMIYIALGVIILLVLGIIIFIKVYILSALNRASSSAQNLVSTIDSLPATVEIIMKNVEADKIKQNKPRFMRNTLGR